MVDRFPSGALFMSNAWPVALGALTGDIVATSAEWTRPGLIAVMSGVLVQIFIAFMRSAFSERKNTMNALKALLREQRLAAQQMDRTARRVRHELANRANRAELKASLLEEGVPLERVRDRLARIPPLYDLDAEAAGTVALTYQGNSRKLLAVARAETDPDTQLAPRDSEGSILVAPHPRTNAEDVGDEHLVEYLSDDRSAVMHSEAFKEAGEVPALFKSHTALLQGEGADKHVNVIGNTFSGSGDDAVIGPSGWAYARSLQRIIKTGNYVEATLKVGQMNDTAAVGLIGE